MLGHNEVEQKNVGFQLECQFHSFGAVRNLAYNLQVRFHLEQTPQAITENRMIVSDHQPNLLWRGL